MGEKLNSVGRSKLKKTAAGLKMTYGCLFSHHMHWSFISVFSGCSIPAESSGPPQEWDANSANLHKHKWSTNQRPRQEGRPYNDVGRRMREQGWLLGSGKTKRQLVRKKMSQAPRSQTRRKGQIKSCGLEKLYNVVTTIPWIYLVGWLVGWRVGWLVGC